MADEEVYQRFIEWLGDTWWRLTDSEMRLPMITSYVTPEQAAFLTGFPRNMLDGGMTVDELAEAKKMDRKELAPKLKELCVRGLLNERRGGDSIRYALNDSFFIFLRAIFWPGRENETAKSAAPHVNKHFLDGWFDQWADVHLSGLRSLPSFRCHRESRTGRKVLRRGPGVAVRRGWPFRPCFRCRRDDTWCPEGPATLPH